MASIIALYICFPTVQGDGLGALDLTDVNTHPTQASDQQNTLRADIVIDRHQLAFPRLRGGGASLYTGAQDSKCEVCSEGRVRPH